MLSRTLVVIALLAPVAVQAQTVAITGGTVYPVSGPRIENGTVLIQNGRIVAVGSNIQVPAGARRIDASGKWVTPGFIHPWTSIGLQEIGLSADPSDQVAQDDAAVAASFRPWDAFNAESPLIEHVRHDGVTTLGVAPAGNLIAGQHALVDLVDGTGAQMLRRAPSAVVAQLASAQAGGTGARGQLIAKLRDVLRDAREWPRLRAAYEQNRARPLAAEPADLEALQPVLSGDIPLVIAANRAAEIDAALAVARDFDIRIVLVGAAEAWMRAAELARAGVPVIVGGIRNIPADFNSLNSRGDNAALLRAAGVDVILFVDSYGDGGSFNGGNIRFEAGNAVANGLPWDQALRAVTLAPARAFGADGAIGALAPGLDANVVVWSGDPFEFSTHAETVLIRGTEVSLNTREQELTRRYRTLPPTWR